MSSCDSETWFSLFHNSKVPSTFPKFLGLGILFYFRHKSMAISLRSRFLTLFIRPPNLKFPTFLQFTTASTAAEQYYTHLQKNGGNIEKTLSTVKAKLDSSCVNEVLNRCLVKNSILGLRFFIWAGVQSDYRHSSYMYSKACKSLGIKRNPRSIFDVFEGYRSEGCSVSLKAFKVVLNLCRMAKLADEALWVLRKMPEFNCRPDTTVYNVVIRVVCGKGDMDTANMLMNEMSAIDLYPDVITYVMMIKGFCDAGRVEDACGLIKVMRENGCPPNAVAYSALLDGVCRFGSMERALELLEEMEKEAGDCSPNVVTYTLVIQNFCEKNRSMEALAILDRMEARGLAPNRVTASTLIKGFCEEGHVEEAYKVIDKVTKGGHVSAGECYSSLVVALLRIKNLEEAEKLFRRMLGSGLKPDGLACSILLKQLCLEGRVIDGFDLYDEMEKIGCLSSIDSDVCSILLVGLCQKSHFVEAAKLSRTMLDKGVKLKAPYVDSIIEHLK